MSENMLLRKVSVKEIGELRHLELACVYPWPESRLRWDLVKIFLRKANKCVTSFPAGHYMDDGSGFPCGKANYSLLTFSRGGSNAVSRLPKATENKTVKNIFRFCKVLLDNTYWCDTLCLVESCASAMPGRFAF